MFVWTSGRIVRLVAGMCLALGLSLPLAGQGSASPGIDPDSIPVLEEPVKATGKVSSRDGVLEHGCQRHGYRYRVRPHGHDWSLELFLRDRRGKQVATGWEWKGGDPRRGRGHFEFCSQSTRPGRFTVKARLTWDDGDYHERWLEPRTIRLRRP